MCYTLNGDFMKYLYWYLLIINAAAFLICAYDKLMAIKQKRRVPEKTLALLSVIGGSVGLYVAMQLVRHKTQKPKFFVGVPLIILAQITVAHLIFRFFC